MNVAPEPRASRGQSIEALERVNYLPEKIVAGFNSDSDFPNELSSWLDPEIVRLLALLIIERERHRNPTS